MDSSETIVAWLTGQTAWAYHGDSPMASEPAALTALALMAHRQSGSSALDWLTDLQGADGSVGVMLGQPTPAWTTAQAVLAWALADRHAGNKSLRYFASAARGTDWLLGARGEPLERIETTGHDSTLIGWPWVEGTHSWIEPTAWSVLALKAIGMSQHARTREAVRLLVDRLLPDGGCNFGNTFVLGQQLLPHLQASGVCLLALAGERIDDPRIGRTCDYVERQLNRRTATASLCFGLLGLAAHERRFAMAGPLLAAAGERMLVRDRSAYKLSLVALAARAEDRPLTTPPPERSR
ncbi:MAG TPA: hypothetical protein VMF30_11395 [Pirellulales bacterium]|nr:hypothetical protein [Pirellulales bacterium]